MLRKLCVVTPWSVISGVLFFWPFLSANWHYSGLSSYLSFFLAQGFIRRSRTVLHQVAFYTLCSVVFTIMRFPIRVVAIAGVEAEAREGETAFGMVFSVDFL